MESHLEDDDLVDRTLAGAPTAFEALVRRYRKPALASALAILGDFAEAEDVVQDSMVRAYEQLATLRTPTKFGGWLLTMVRRRALNTLRATRRRRLEVLPSNVASTAASADAGLAERDIRMALSAALVALSPMQRDVVLLSDLGELSHAQVALALGITEGMSRRHLSDGRRRLRQQLQLLRPEL